jgi:23S rRNA pseudouridine1911/1915/1917 synthase
MTQPKYDVAPTDDISLTQMQPTDFSDESLPIIYIDENVIVVNKPIGVLTHSKGVMNDEFTVADFFRRYTTFNVDGNRPGIVHRLDRDTSGVIIGARNPETAEMLQKQFSNRKTVKTYAAVIDGILKNDSAIIDLPIGRNPAHPSMFRVDSKGKAAVTKYDILSVKDGESFVRLMPRSGRTHQLRVHMSYLNTPIVGDVVYGIRADRLYLHAYSLEITIPVSNRQTFTAPLPDEFTKKFPGIKM